MTKKRAGAEGADAVNGKTGWAAVSSRRNKGYAETHVAIIAATVQLISEKGVDALSVAAVARSMGVDRKTVYYHFADREALLESALQWSSDQLTRGFLSNMPRSERTAHISRFVLDNPGLIKLWIDDFIAPGDIRTRYPNWDAFVDGLSKVLVNQGETIDVEIYATIMLTSAFIAPRVYRNSVRPDLSVEEVTEAFAREQARVLSRDAELPGDSA